MMDCIEAFDILKKYSLDEAIDKEFKMKTKKDVGKMNVPLRLDICANHAYKKAKELMNKKKEIMRSNTERCPNFEIQLKKNQYTQDDCLSINFTINQDFCYECEFYLLKLKYIDDSIKELKDAVKYFEHEANYDRIWQ